MLGTQFSLQFDAPPPVIPVSPPVLTRQPQRAPIASGEKSKARDILAAIRTLKHRGRKTARHRGREAIARPLRRLRAGRPFDFPRSGHRPLQGWLAGHGRRTEDAADPTEYDSAKRTTFNAFYTSPTVIAAIHEAIARLGIPANATILEPGCGIGNFMSQGREGTRFIGVELDSISGRIARALHPGHDIRIESFRDTKLPEDRIDAVIGNVPFADLKLDYHGQKLSLHDYFFAKSIDALKPGGVLALVTSHFTLDKQNAAIREYLAGRRPISSGRSGLPSDAFKREGTAVVTDIVFLRKRAPGQAAKHVDPDWLGVSPLAIEAQGYPVNRYFLNHPEMVLGTWSRKDTLYGGEGYSVLGNGDLAGQLKAAIHRLPEFAPLQIIFTRDHPPSPSHRRRRNATSPKAAFSSPMTAPFASP